MNEEQKAQQERDARIEKARQELAALGAQSKKLEKARWKTGIAVVVVLLLGWHGIGTCSRSAVLGSHYDGAQGVFIQRCKSLGQYKSPHHFDPAIKEMNRIADLAPRWPEPHMYKASAYLMSYQQELLAQRKPDQTLLSQAEECIGECFKRKTDYPPAHYLSAALKLMEKDYDGASASLDDCETQARAFYKNDEKALEEWLQQCRKGREALSKPKFARVRFSCLPTKQLLPKWQLIQ